MATIAGDLAAAAATGALGLTKREETVQYIHSPTKELATGSLTLCISLCVDCALEISLQTEITRFLHALKEGRNHSRIQ